MQAFPFYVIILYFSLFQNRMFCFKTVIWDQSCLNGIKRNKNKIKLTDSKLKHFGDWVERFIWLQIKFWERGLVFQIKKEKKYLLTIHSALVWSFGSAGFWESSQLQSSNPKWKFSILWGEGGEETGRSKGERVLGKKYAKNDKK